MKTLTMGMTGFVLGVGAARLLERRGGARRRAEVVQRSQRLAHEAADFAGKSSRDLKNRSRGLWHALFAWRGPVEDEVLIERVRSRLGRVCSHPGAIEVFACDSRVELRGNVLASEHHQVVREVERVPGALAVDDQLEVHQRSENIPALQGGAGRHVPRPELIQENWAPATRLLAGAAGAGLIGWGAERRDLTGLGIAGLGAVLLGRSVTNLPVRRLFGVGGATRHRRAQEHRAGQGNWPQKRDEAVLNPANLPG